MKWLIDWIFSLHTVDYGESILRIFEFHNSLDENDDLP